MRGTPYVERRMTLQDGVWKEGNRIIVGERTWDGIDKPDYDAKLELTADEARYIGNELIKIAEKVDGKSKRDRTYAKIKRATLETAAKAKKEAEA